jgi:hypothetical protein
LYELYEKMVELPVPIVVALEGTRSAAERSSP